VSGLVLNPSDSLRFEIKPGPRLGQFDLIISLVIANATVRKMDALRFDSEAEAWGGLAEFAAGKLADLAVAMHGVVEESAGQDGRARR
jgi:hypothetical protein